MTGASSSAPGHASRLVNDRDTATYWMPAPNDPEPWVLVDAERILTARRLIVTLREPGRYALRAELQAGDGSWALLAEQPMGDVPQAMVELTTQAQTGRKVRLRVRSATGEPVGVAELRVVGTLKPW